MFNKGECESLCLTGAGRQDIITLNIYLYLMFTDRLESCFQVWEIYQGFSRRYAKALFVMGFWEDVYAWHFETPAAV